MSGGEAKSTGRSAGHNLLAEFDDFIDSFNPDEFDLNLRKMFEQFAMTPTFIEFQQKGRQGIARDSARDIQSYIKLIDGASVQEIMKEVIDSRLKEDLLKSTTIRSMQHEQEGTPQQADQDMLHLKATTQQDEEDPLFHIFGKEMYNELLGCADRGAGFLEKETDNVECLTRSTPGVPKDRPGYQFACCAQHGCTAPGKGNAIVCNHRGLYIAGEADPYRSEDERRVFGSVDAEIAELQHQVAAPEGCDEALTKREEELVQQLLDSRKRQYEGGVLAAIQTEIELLDGRWHEWTACGEEALGRLEQGRQNNFVVLQNYNMVSQKAREMRTAATHAVKYQAEHASNQFDAWCEAVRRAWREGQACWEGSRGAGR